MKVNLLANFLFLSTVGLIGCTAQSKDNTETAAPRTVPVTAVTKLDTVIYSEYIADIQAVKNVEVRSRLAGFLDKIYVEEGAAVTQGQVLFKIHDEEYKAEYAKAEAALNNAIADAKTVKLEKARTKILVDNNIVSKTDMDLAAAKQKAAESRVAEARSVLQHARTRLANTMIRAPFSGRIDRIPLKAGSLLEEGSLLTSVSDLSAVNVYFDISEKEYLNMVADASFKKNNIQKRVKLTLANGELYPHQGDAVFAESEFAQNTGSLSLKARFPNPTGLLKHGASGKISVPVETGELLAAHQKSVFEIQDRTYVYVLQPDNTIKMTAFKAGQRVGHYYTVLDGLETKETLRDGLKVSPKTMALPQSTLVAKN